MAKYRQGDTPGARFGGSDHISNAAVASGGANSILGMAGPMGVDRRVRDAYWTPTASSQSATQSATYRQLLLINGGTGGAGTTAIGTLNLSATKGQWAPAGFTLDTTHTITSGGVVLLSQGTVGGTDANGTVLVAGQVDLDYEVL